MLKALKKYLACLNSGPPDDEQLLAGVCSAYSAAARTPNAKHPFPVGRLFAESLGYDAALLDSIPECAYASFAGVSNVSVRAAIPAGATVLDLGCGAGLDTVIAARKTGKTGKVIGVDFSQAMLDQAEAAGRKAGLDDIIDYRCASAESLPLADSSVDIVLANGIFNLNPRREQIFAEISRVVKDGGLVFAAELVFTGPVARKSVRGLDDWFA